MQFKGRARKTARSAKVLAPKQISTLRNGVKVGCEDALGGHMLSVLMAREGRKERSPGAAGATEAAARLRHDLGKSVRLSAPEQLEAETDALRARLSADVLATRSGPGGVKSAADVFEAWMREDGDALARREALAEPIGRIENCVSEASDLAQRLSTLSREELERLDGLTRTIAEECRTLLAAARAEDR